MILTILAICCAILALSLFCVAAGITPEDAARLTVQGATFLPCYLRAVIAELRPDPPSDAPPKLTFNVGGAGHTFTHNGDRYVYRGVSVTTDPTTEPTRQPPPKSPES